MSLSQNTTSSLSPISNATTTATTLNNIVLATANTIGQFRNSGPGSTVGYQPQTLPNAGSTLSSAQQLVQTVQSFLGLPPAFIFHYEGEQSIMCNSDITDHFIEDNTSIQDQIALKPVEITTQGYIGELNDVAPFGLQTLQQVSNSLLLISAYQPDISTTAIIAYNEAFQAYQVAQNAAASSVSAWSSISGTGGTAVFTGNQASDLASINQNNIYSPSVLQAFGVSSQNKQQVAFQWWYGAWISRTQFTLQTPWAVFRNMAIKSLHPIQNAETRMITNFEVTFKQIRTASSSILPPQNAISQGQLASQSSPIQNNGTSTPAPGPSLTTGIGMV